MLACTCRWPNLKEKIKTLGSFNAVFVAHNYSLVYYYVFYMYFYFTLIFDFFMANMLICFASKHNCVM